MNTNIFKLGKPIKDKVSKVMGTLTHVVINMDQQQSYIFQPKGLNPKTRQPVDSMFIEKARIIGGEEVEVDLPLEVIGSEVEDIASGFKGTAISLVYHINGCTHFEVKSEGILEESGATITPHEFDIRRLKGKKIKKLTEEEVETSKRRTPSPMKTISKSSR